MKRLGGARSVELDVFGSDLDRSKYDLETERNDKRADHHRARYHASVVDIESLDAGQDFAQLPDSFIIFLTDRPAYWRGLNEISVIRPLVRCRGRAPSRPVE